MFQAKEAIDDLKLEIEEWRELSASKDTELRGLYHRLGNDFKIIDKKVEFEGEVHYKNYDASKPVAVEERVKNFIKMNKNKIRSRSKASGNCTKQESQTLRTKSSLKRQ